MTKASEAFEHEIESMVNQYRGTHIPNNLPEWMIEEGIQPGAKILKAVGIGGSGGKTDVIIYLQESEPIKISAKLRNADHFGNWYSHKRFLLEFGEDAFVNMTLASTRFANNWCKTASAPFVGVSICFGKRAGDTGQAFTDIFTTKDILTVARGYGSGDGVANCMYIDNRSANNIEDMINYLEPITVDTVNMATDNFKVAHRPINPMTEGTNRGKCVYTRFMPYQPLDRPSVITNPRELFELGEFVPVEPNSLNHNRILNDLESKYNIIIPRK